MFTDELGVTGLTGTELAGVYSLIACMDGAIVELVRRPDQGLTAGTSTVEAEVGGVDSGGVVEGAIALVYALEGALMSRRLPEAEDGRRSSEIACAIRNRLPNCGISSSFNRFASSPNSRSPEISCSREKSSDG